MLESGPGKVVDHASDTGSVAIVTGPCNKYQDHLCLQQRLLGECTFAQARLSLLYSIEISCAG